MSVDHSKKQDQDAEGEFQDGLDLIIPSVRGRLKILYAIRGELEKESDRGCALVAAAYLENEIAALLSQSFVEMNKSMRKELFDFNGPIGTFSAKIKLAYAMGLISAEVRNALDRIRGIRNKFAHLQHPLNFEDAAIAQQIDALMPSCNVKTSTRKDSFIVKVQAVSAVIHTRIACAHHIKEPEHEDVVVAESIQDYELDIAARQMIKITAPEITYEQALEMARKVKQIGVGE
jgi:DNA-binding MltR family transcriptional regulator